MYYNGAPEADLRVSILNCLDDATLATIMSLLGPRGGNYYEIKEILIASYGSAEQLEDDKINFLSISIGKDETLREFGRRFVTEAKSLFGYVSYNPKGISVSTPPSY